MPVMHIVKIAPVKCSKGVLLLVKTYCKDKEDPSKSFTQFEGKWFSPESIEAIEKIYNSYDFQKKKWSVPMTAGCYDVGYGEDKLLVDHFTDLFFKWIKKAKPMDDYNASQSNEENKLPAQLSADGEIVQTAEVLASPWKFEGKQIKIFQGK